MMIKALKKAITASISDVLETMFFMVIEFHESDAGDRLTILARPNLRGCTLQFTGPFSGEFTLIAPEDLFREMAVDFMGESPENITVEHAEGTLKEAVNMIAGNTFAHYDDTLVFSVGIPEVMKPADIKSVFECGGKECLFFKVMTGKSEIVLKMVIRQ